MKIHIFVVILVLRISALLNVPLSENITFPVAFAINNTVGRVVRTIELISVENNKTQNVLKLYN